jgi:hypothetical protein
MLGAGIFVGTSSAIKAAEKSVVITYPSSTPGWLLDKAKEAIINAGGIITHEYHIFK